MCSASVSLNEGGKGTTRSLPPLPWVTRIRQASRSTSSSRMATSSLLGPSVSLVRLLTHELFTHIVGPAPGVSPGRGANLSGGPSPPGRPPTGSAGLCASGFVVVAGARPSLTSRATKRLNLHLGDRRQALVPKRGAT